MLQFYNTLSRRKEIFRPLHKKWVGLYTCGPTVYNFAHIGNLRTYIFEDILRRTLEYSGFRVRQVMNITDVDDKIIREARASGKNILEFVKPFKRAFFDDLEKLNVERAWKYPQATEHIREMVALIQKLLKKGLAYRADGSVYFDISKFRKYGKLSRISARNRTFEGRHRIDVDEYAKKDVKDFVLWKAAKSGEPAWAAPFGKGRPGWHIECSAMSMKYLGSTFDIHAGGVDLIFPHHENEIAQSEGATGKPFAHFFVEGEHLLVNGQKMAKSLGNFYTLRDLEARGFDPLAFRYLALTAHYRSKLNFTWKALRAAENSLEHLYDFVRSGQHRVLTTRSGQHPVLTNKGERFWLALSHDLDTPKALAVMWGLIHDYNKNPLRYNPQEILKLFYDFDRVFGLGLKQIKPEKIPAKIRTLVEKRKSLRHEKKWKEADAMREKIKKLGYLIEDTSKGPKIIKQ